MYVVPTSSPQTNAPFGFRWSCHPTPSAEDHFHVNIVAHSIVQCYIFSDSSPFTRHTEVCIKQQETNQLFLEMKLSNKKQACLDAHPSKHVFKRNPSSWTTLTLRMITQ